MIDIQIETLLILIQEFKWKPPRRRSRQPALGSIREMRESVWKNEGHLSWRCHVPCMLCLMLTTPLVKIWWTLDCHNTYRTHRAPWMPRSWNQQISTRFVLSQIPRKTRLPASLVHGSLTDKFSGKGWMDSDHTNYSGGVTCSTSSLCSVNKCGETEHMPLLSHFGHLILLSLSLTLTLTFHVCSIKCPLTKSTAPHPPQQRRRTILKWFNDISQRKLFQQKVELL